MSGVPEQGYFADGVTEDIITELSRFRDLLVIARNSSFQYRGKDVDIGRVGRELDVQVCAPAWPWSAAFRYHSNANA